MKILTILSQGKWYIAITLVAAGGLYYYFNVYTVTDTAQAPSFYVVETVDHGEVTSGIQVTGDIIAAQKLDIDVYKQLSRIDVVNIQNGSHVNEDDILISFDKSDAYVDTQSARTAVTEAELALEEERINAADPNTAIRTKENQIAGTKRPLLMPNRISKMPIETFLMKI